MTKSRQNIDITGVEITKIAYVEPPDVRHNSRYMKAGSRRVASAVRLRDLLHASKQQMVDRVVKKLERADARKEIPCL